MHIRALIYSLLEWNRHSRIQSSVISTWPEAHWDVQSSLGFECKANQIISKHICAGHSKSPKPFYFWFSRDMWFTTLYIWNIQGITENYYLCIGSWVFENLFWWFFHLRSNDTLNWFFIWHIGQKLSILWNAFFQFFWIIGFN